MRGKNSKKQPLKPQPLSFFLKSSLASHRINTRSHPNPNPPLIVDNPERILWQNSNSGKSAANRSLLRTNSVPENLVVLEDSHFDLNHTKNIFRTRSQGDLNETNLDIADLQQILSREASSSTPPDSQLLYHFSPFHKKFAQN